VNVKHEINEKIEILEGAPLARSKVTVPIMGQN